MSDDFSRGKMRPFGDDMEKIKTKIPSGWRPEGWRCPEARVIGDIEWYPTMLGYPAGSVVWWYFNGQRWPEYLLEWR